MAWKKRLVNFLRRGKKAQAQSQESAEQLNAFSRLKKICKTEDKTVSENSRSRLERLPSELILCITDHLATPDIVCLSHTNKHMRLATREPNVSRETKDISVSTLAQISKDIPHVFTCHACAKYHRLEHITHPADNRLRDHTCPDINPFHRDRLYNPLWQYFDVHMTLESIYNFRKHHLVAAMKNYYSPRTKSRSGIRSDRGVAVKSLGYKEVVHWPKKSRITTLLSVDARVCEIQGRSSLVLQLQNWILFRSNPGPKEIIPGLSPIRICGHIPSNSTTWESIMGAEVKDWKFTREDANAGTTGNSIGIGAGAADKSTNNTTNITELTNGTQSRHLECLRCGVIFKCSLRDCQPDGKAMVITRWLDLGAGLEIADQQWTRLTAGSRTTVMPTIAPETESSSSVPLWRAFEEAWADKKKKDRKNKGSGRNITERNESYLKDNDYELVMTPTVDDVYWVLY